MLCVAKDDALTGRETNSVRLRRGGNSRRDRESPFSQTLWYGSDAESGGL